MPTQSHLKTSGSKLVGELLVSFCILDMNVCIGCIYSTPILLCCCLHLNIYVIMFSNLFMSLLLNGIGVTTYFTLVET